jgi:hypothetical protein
METGALSYKLEGNKLKVTQKGITLVMNPTKGIVSAGTINPSDYGEE